MHHKTDGGTQPVQRGVVIRNASTDDTCKNAEEKLREYRSSIHKFTATVKNVHK